MTVVIEQSPSDARQYRSLQLANGINVLLIHDPEATSAPTPEVEGDGSVDAKHDRSDDDLDSLVSDDPEGSEESEEGSESEEEHQHVHHHGSKHPEHPAKPVKKAAAALSVGVGSLSDPWDIQGLSHYLEHMLFMGSEKFPDENEYDAFLTAHGGSSNAMTEAEATTYYFDVSPESLRGALERFAQFFSCPLVKQGAMEREVEAVNNEFTGVLQSDGCRLQQLQFHTSREGHPFRKFSWGNKKSLIEDPTARGLDVRDRLLDYYKAQYSAERMRLVILGGEPLDTLQGWAEELFSGVPAGKGPAPDFQGAGFPFEGGRLFILPAVREEHKLQATFQLPCLNKLYGKKADDYISHLVGHEGAGSLLSALKARGWATELCGGVSDQSTVAWLFTITITLTEAGLSEGLGCGLGCIRLMFEYLSMLRHAGPQEWAYREMATIAGMKFKFQEEEDASDYVTQLATDLHIYPPHHVLLGPYLHQEFDPALSHYPRRMTLTPLLERADVSRHVPLTMPLQISKLLGMMTPAAVRLDLQTSAFERCADAVAAAVPAGCRRDTEPWFGIPYTEVQLPEDLLQSWESATPSPDLSLPPQNSYLPTDFALVSEAEPGADAATSAASKAQLSIGKANGHAAPAAEDSPAAGVEALSLSDAAVFPTPPALVVDEPGLRLWHKLDATFRLPRTNTYWRLASPLTYDSARSAALAHLTLKLLEDALCETAYLADVAGLHYNTWFEGSQGLDVKVDGFSHKLPLLCEYIFQTLAGLRPDEDSFQRVREALVRQYHNANMKGLKHASYLRLMTLKDVFWAVEPVLQAGDWGRERHSLVQLISQALGELEGLGREDVRRYLPALLSSLHLEAFLHGNIRQGDAVTLGRAVRAALLAGAAAAGNGSGDGGGGERVAAGGLLAADARPVDRCVQLPRPALSKNGEEENSVVEAYFQCCSDTDADRALVDLLDQILCEPLFNVLRTQEQLGYTVHSGMRLTHGILGFCVVIMSGVHGPAYLDSRIEAFLEGFAERLGSMAEEEFEKNRAALLSTKLMKDRNLVEESDRHWACIASRRYNFGARRDEVAHLRLVTLAQVQDFYSKYLRPRSATRRKLSVHILGREHRAELEADGGSLPAGVEVFGDPEALKRGLHFYPAVVGAPVVAVRT
ncbi:hypothetical protein N2152v2_010821 [Parachlorella kessleri]